MLKSTEVFVIVLKKDGSKVQLDNKRKLNVGLEDGKYYVNRHNAYRQVEPISDNTVSVNDRTAWILNPSQVRLAKPTDLGLREAAVEQPNIPEGFLESLKPKASDNVEDIVDEIIVVEPTTKPKKTSKPKVQKSERQKVEAALAMNYGKLRSSKCGQRQKSWARKSIQTLTKRLEALIEAE